jgi:hypothetical protein
MRRKKNRLRNLLTVLLKPIVLESFIRNILGSRTMIGWIVFKKTLVLEFCLDLFFVKRIYLFPRFSLYLGFLIV